MFRFVTIIPFEFLVILLLLVFMWVAFDLGGLLITIVILALLQSSRTITRS